MTLAPRGYTSADQADQRQDVLTKAGQSRTQGPNHEFANLRWLSRCHKHRGGKVMQHKVADHGQRNTRPPRQHRHEVKQILRKRCFLTPSHVLSHV